MLKGIFHPPKNKISCTCTLLQAIQDVEEFTSSEQISRNYMTVANGCHKNESSNSRLKKSHQGSRVRPNFSMVRLKTIWGCTGATSCSKKKSLCDSESLPVVQQQTHIRPISWSKPIRNSEGWTPPPSDWLWSKYSCTSETVSSVKPFKH